MVDDNRDEAPDEPIEGAEDLPDEVKDGDVSDEETETEDKPE